MRTYQITGKNGPRWGIDYRHPKTGARVRQIIGKSRTQAERVLAQIQSDIISGKYGLTAQSTDKHSIDEFLGQYFQHVATINRPETVKQDKTRIKPLLAFLDERGVKHLSKITPALITEFQTGYLADHSRKSWNNLLGVMKAILNRAVAWEAIQFNPITQIKPVKIDRTFNYFERGEIDRILADCPPELLTGIMLLLYTGMRRSELWNLRWRDIDLNNGLIHIRPHGEYTTKSRKQRAVPINRELLKHLKGLSRKSEYVYRPTKDIHWIRQKFIELLKSLGLKGTLHDLRHTFASHLAIKGESIMAINKLLGHSDIKTTMIYSHLSDKAVREAIDNIDYGRGRNLASAKIKPHKSLKNRKN